MWRCFHSYAFIRPTLSSHSIIFMLHWIVGSAHTESAPPSMGLMLWYNIPLTLPYLFFLISHCLLGISLFYGSGRWTTPRWELVCVCGETAGLLHDQNPNMLGKYHLCDRLITKDESGNEQHEPGGTNQPCARCTTHISVSRPGVRSRESAGGVSVTEGFVVFGEARSLGD